MGSRRNLVWFGIFIIGAIITSLKAADEGQPLDLDPIRALRELEQQRVKETYDLEKYIPAEELKAEDSPGVISQKIIGQTVKTLVEDSPLSRSPAVRSMENLNESLSADLRLSSPASSSYWMREIEHQLSFRLRADQGRAFLRYRGLTEAELSYYLFGQALRFELNEQLTSRLQLILVQEISHEEILYEVNVRWAW